MKKYYLLLLPLLVAIFSFSLIACEEDDENNKNGKTPVTPEKPVDPLDNVDFTGTTGIKKWEFGTSPETSILFRMETTKGGQIIVEARKDKEGIPTSLSSLAILTEGSNPELSQFLFDEKNRPTDMTAPNGVRILYEWLTDTKAAITFIDPETDEQLNTVYDYALDKDQQQVPVAPKVQQKRKGETTLTVNPLNMNSQGQAPMRLKNGLGDRIGTFLLQQCGVNQPGQYCYVKVYDHGSYGDVYTEMLGYRGYYEATSQSDGSYQYTLPIVENHPQIAEFLAKAGPKIKSLIDKMCLPNMGGVEATDPMTIEMVTAICLTVMAKTAITGPLAVKITAACTALGASLLFYCNYLNKAFVFNDPNSPTVQDLPIVRNMIDATFGKLWEKLVVIPSYDYKPVDVYICVTGFQKTTQHFAYTINPVSNDPLPLVEINTSTEPAIKSFKLEPPAPVAKQGYKAIATLSCIPEGSSIKMSIVGTDGYSNSNTEDLSKNVINYECVLNVPGANTEGVKDVCTVEVKLPDGKVLQKQASLVFQ